MTGVDADRSRTIMVGDSETDIRVARAAHIPVIAVDFGYTEIPVSQLHPNLVIGHFDHLLRAVQSLLSERHAVNR
jgi:phosphoglycolate phosphatase